jgi:hypothetical protein
MIHMPPPAHKVTFLRQSSCTYPICYASADILTFTDGIGAFATSQYPRAAGLQDGGLWIAAFVRSSAKQASCSFTAEMRPARHHPIASVADQADARQRVHATRGWVRDRGQRENGCDRMGPSAGLPGCTGAGYGTRTISRNCSPPPSSRTGITGWGWGWTGNRDGGRRPSYRIFELIVHSGFQKAPHAEYARTDETSNNDRTQREQR